MEKLRFGLDIGGTKIELRAYEHSSEHIFKQRIPTPNNYSDFVQAIVTLVHSSEQKLGGKATIGIGLPGAVCPRTGLIKNANCNFLNGTRLTQDLNSHLDREVSIANDANCFVLSEAIDGVAIDKKIVFGVILGTGCGGGLVINKQVITGANAIAGEWGHNPLPSYSVEKDGLGQPCYCGQQNCIERFISGTGFEMLYAQRFRIEKSAPQIIEDFNNGDHKARLIYAQLVDHIARSLAYVINIIDPDVIVLGGGLSNIKSLYIDIPKQLKYYVFSEESYTPILPAKFGDSSGVRGASWLPTINNSFI